MATDALADRLLTHRKGPAKRGSERRERAMDGGGRDSRNNQKEERGVRVASDTQATYVVYRSTTVDLPLWGGRAGVECHLVQFSIKCI